MRSFSSSVHRILRLFSVRLDTLVCRYSEGRLINCVNIYITDHLALKFNARSQGQIAKMCLLKKAKLSLCLPN
jgi:hypothetical protein